MKRANVTSAVLALVVCVSVALPADAAERKFRESLRGFEEVAAVSTVASGRFTAEINKAETAIAWRLSYTDLEGAVQQAHIHLGQKDVNGGISVFLCSNLGNGPAGTQACPPPPATISGTIMASDVSPAIPATAGARAQGLDTGELDELIRAMRAGVTYVNVHSDKFPGGEIRSQLGDHDHD